MKIHSLATLFPPMSSDEYDALKNDVVKNGQLDPITVWNDEIIDGAHRYKICQELGIEPYLQDFNGTINDAISLSISKNIMRRHLSVSQRAMIANDLAHQHPGGDRRSDDHSANSQNGLTQGDAATLLNVGTKAVSEARKIANFGDDKLVDAVRNNELSLNAASAAVNALQTVGSDDRSSVFELWNTGTAATIPSAVNMLRKQRLYENPPVLPQGKYSTIVVDPPWPLDIIITDARPNQFNITYPTMSIEEIASMSVKDMMDDNCWVFMWTTQKFFFDARDILKAWGCDVLSWWFTWHKPTGFPVLFESPQWNAEYVMAGRIGKPEFVTKKGLQLCFDAPIVQHSYKPDAFYAMLRRSTHGPRLDMFNRRNIPDFTAWGDGNEL